MKSFVVTVPFVKGLTYLPELGRYDGTNFQLTVEAESDRDALERVIVIIQKLRDESDSRFHNLGIVAFPSPAIRPRLKKGGHYKYFAVIEGRDLVIIEAITLRQAKGFVWPQLTRMQFGCVYELPNECWKEIIVKYNGSRPKSVVPQSSVPNAPKKKRRGPETASLPFLN